MFGRGCRRIVRVLIVMTMLLFSCCSIWGIAVQNYRFTLTSFEHFETEEQVRTYFKEMWTVKKTTQTQVMSELETLAIKNCINQGVFYGKVYIHCRVLAPRAKPQFGIINAAFHNLYIVYYYDITIRFDNNLLDYIGANFWSSLPAGSF